MTILPITAKVTRSAAAADAATAVATVTPLNNWTLFLKVWTFTSVSNGTNRARLNFEDSVDNFMSDILTGPTRCIVPVTTIPEGRVYSTRWRDFDDLRIGISSAKLRTNLTRITGGSITYEAWLQY